MHDHSIRSPKTGLAQRPLQHCCGGNRARVATQGKTAATPRLSTSQAQRHPANRVLERLLVTRTLQAKLAVSQPADVHEQEADHAADEVMRMPEPRPDTADTRGALVARMCKDCPEELNRAPLDEEDVLQTNANGASTGDVSTTVEDQIRSLQGHGQPLSDNARAFMEPRFGADFGNVRVHTDPNAASLASAVSAHAFTVGPDIVFGAGRYEPDSAAGRQLIAHELSHVVQQGSATALADTASADRPAYRETDEGPTS